MLRRRSLILFAVWGWSGWAAAADHAVILTYHHVADDTPASTSVSPQRFQAHLDYLAGHGFHVLPLTELLDRLVSGEGVPENSVAITFDDAYESVYREALPRLGERGWPFTVFVSTDAVERHYRPYMDWEQLRALVEYGAEIGNHTRSHPHMLRRRDGESRTVWRERMRTEITAAQEVLSSHLSHLTRLFAYPYGEYDAELEGLVKELGYRGLGQQSGAVGPQSDFLALPRFPFSVGYDSLDQFALRSRARPLPLQIVSGGAHVVAGDEPYRAMNLQVPPGPYRLSRLACYATGQGRMRLSWIDRSAGRFSIRTEAPLSPGRDKYNCTAPHERLPGVYFWWSQLLVKKQADGSWYPEPAPTGAEAASEGR